MTLTFDKNIFFWSASPTGIRYGSPEDNLEFYLKGVQTMILTTSTAFSFVPKSISENFFFNLFKSYQIEYTADSGMFIVDCSVTFPPVHFLISDYWVTINGEDMVIDISPNQDNTMCVCTFLPAVDEIWVIGQSLYKDYYMVHDPDMSEITFFPTEKKLKEPLVTGVQPQFVLQKAFNMIAFWFRFGGMLLTALATWGITGLIEAWDKPVTTPTAASRTSYDQKN